MTTDTTKPTGASEPPATTEVTPVLAMPATAARHLASAGAVLTLVSTFLAWTYTDEFPGNLTVTGYPGGLQVIVLVGALLTLLYAVAGYGVRGLGWLNPNNSNNPVALLALGTLATAWFTDIAIAVQLGGLAHLDPGAYLAAVGTLAAFVGTLGLPLDRKTKAALPKWNWFLAVILGLGTLYLLFRYIRLGTIPRQAKRPKELPTWAEILIIVAVFGIGLLVISYGIDTEYSELFIGYLITAGMATAAFGKAGLLARLTALTYKHRGLTMTAAFIAAACFPFTQSTDTFTLIGVNILIFATVALGLNIVVGLAGLLDLGYVAFLGVGAYTAALVSGTSSSVFGVQFPFWAAALSGAAVSLVFGVLIGAPTLRLRGDYLAIVTLGFGEIFRLTVANLDGETGPRVTNGPNGVSNVPPINLFGYDFGEEHSLFGMEIGKFTNYFLLMLLATLIVVLVFRRAGDSRIGRAWVAIREDETAATAMGINGFRVKLVAFALGAALAGLAGSVQAHVTTTVVPESYQFAGPVPPNSAFLLAAVILGGMGTISGPLLGASLLYLLPAKLAFLKDFQLLGFGIALILLMRFRPEGLIANRRAQLEYHETDQLAVPDQPTPGTGVGITKAGA
ncbi:branched-chain amino acid ABC transporter permease [Streptomyces sp. NPDC051561]|uniref:branched-chain amino acid ABC transporter permease n=1 Tax=Streptomyces sp. NPDC051561 TaxID=3365658 RepID=UPI003789DB64